MCFSVTFHAIVGEAFTELIHHYEADAERIIGPTKFLEEENLNFISTRTTYTKNSSQETNVQIQFILLFLIELIDLLLESEECCHLFS